MSPIRSFTTAALAAAGLLLFAACQAEAAESRFDIVLVADSAETIAALAPPLRRAGYATAVVGRLERDPPIAAFDGHCIWHPAEEPRRWGPTIRQDGQVTTYPDDVSAASLFLAFLTSFATQGAEQPRFLAVLPAQAFGGESANRVAAAAAEGRRALRVQGALRRPTVVLEITHDAADDGNADVRLSATWLGQPEAGPFVRSAALEDILPTLLDLANLPHDGGEGESRADHLRPAGMRPAAPR